MIALGWSFWKMKRAIRVQHRMETAIPCGTRIKVLRIHRTVLWNEQVVKLGGGSYKTTNTVKMNGKREREWVLQSDRVEKSREGRGEYKRARTLIMLARDVGWVDDYKERGQRNGEIVGVDKELHTNTYVYVFHFISTASAFVVIHPNFADEKILLKFFTFKIIMIFSAVCGWILPGKWGE